MKDHPVAFASRTLSSAEKQYFQVDKEGLAIIFKVHRFTTTCWEDSSRYYLTTNPYSTCLEDQISDEFMLFTQVFP